MFSHITYRCGYKGNLIISVGSSTDTRLIIATPLDNYSAESGGIKLISARGQSWILRQHNPAMRRPSKGASPEKDDAIRAYKEGEAAGEIGRQVECPYPKNTRESEAFRRGFRDAQQVARRLAAGNIVS